MTKIKRHFLLVGKTNQYKKLIANGVNINWTNADTLQYVKDLVADNFGRRAVYITSEKMLTEETIVYPKYFSAGWFVSDDTSPRELVIVAHGETMALASKAMMDQAQKINWVSLSVPV